MATAAQEPAAGRQTERQQLLGGRLSNDDAGDEQREKLLADDVERGSSEDGQRRPRSKPSRPWPAAFFVAISFLGLFTLLALVKLSLFHTPRTAKTEPQVATTFTRRPGSEYVLTSDWDFNAAPTVREYHWVVSDMEGNPDGVFRPMIIINGQFPGEMIRCNRGDTIVVNVENRAVNATSIHWHGIFQNGTNWMDGTVGVTQCPIAPGGKFRYEFKVDGQAGTYFYHGHYAAQALDGLVGPIVIHSPEERQSQQIPYVTDRVVMLQDWYHDLSSGLLLQTLSPGSESSPVPNGALLNGANVLDCSLHPNRRCDNSTASLPSWDLSPNANHRLRLLNVGAFAWFEVTIDEHPTLPITEIDGVDIEPSPEKSVLLGPGQRYSVILSTEDTKSDAVWFRARMVTHCFAENVLPEQGQPEAKATIVYSSGAIDAATATTQDPIVPTSEPDRSVYAVQCRDMRTRKYDPVPAVRAPERADHSWRVRVNLAIGDWRLERGYLNQSSYRVADPRSPTLHRLVDGLRSGNDSFLAEGYNDRAFDPERELVVSSRGAAEVVDVVLQNMDEGNHPFHLHGAQMFALASGHGYFPGYEALGFHAHGRGLLDPANDTVVANPVRRDVATVEGFGWALIRFVADNPGVWLFHCHMTWHGEAGMAMQFVSRVDDMKSWEIPEQNARLCEAKLEELEKGGVPKDDIWIGSFGT